MAPRGSLGDATCAAARSRSDRGATTSEGSATASWAKPLGMYAASPTVQSFHRDHENWVKYEIEVDIYDKVTCS